MPELVKHAASQAVTSPDVISTIAHKLTSCNELMTPVASLVAKVVEEKADKAENLYNRKEKAAEILKSPPSLESSDSKSPEVQKD